MVISSLIYPVLRFHSEILSQEGRGGILLHIEVPSIDDSIDNVLLYVKIAVPCSAYSMGVLG
jgi:hypothetical protein